LTGFTPSATLLIMRQKLQGNRKNTRPPRIRVPNNEQAIFTVDNQKFIGIIKRLSLTGGSAVFTRDHVPNGTLGEMALKTVFGKVEAQIQFLQTGADGMPLTQAFRFLDMDGTSRQRFAAAAELMQREGFSDAKEERGPLDLGLSKLGESIRRLSGAVSSGRRDGAKR
jgi:hypothetical protein